MNIGFDAKRAFQNNTGLGNYSRTLIQSLAKHFPQHNYLLFAPKITDDFQPQNDLVKVISPFSSIHKKFSGAWRRKWVIKDLLENQVDLYHGLSHRIPKGIQRTKIPTVVTIHDLIFERFPDQYSWTDKIIYRAQFKYACKYCKEIIAISEQTKSDLIKFYKVAAEKITVCYQSCNPIFKKVATNAQMKIVGDLYSLPQRYFLYVGSIIERKNLMVICKALVLLKGKLAIPVVVIGRGKAYKEVVKKFIQLNQIEKEIIFLSDNEEAHTNPFFKDSTHLPAIYQMAEALIYPSIFEGFGIPILEALCSSLPVISSNASCMPEVGGDAAIYFDPTDENILAEHMINLISNKELRKTKIEKGLQQATKFSEENCASAVMDVYKKIVV